MSSRSLFLKLALVFSETCFWALLYFCAVGSFKGSYLINPALLFFLTGILTVGNIMISWRPLRRITIVIFNLLLIVLVSLIILRQTGFILVSIPTELLPALNVILVDFIILWLIFRSLYLAHKRSISTVYGHFDLYIILTFLVLFVMGFAHIPLAGEMTWVISAILLNLMTLYISSNSGVNSNPLSGWMLAGIMIMLIYLSSEAVSFLPQISGTAGNIYDLVQKSFLFVVGIIGNLLVMFLRFFMNRNRPESTAGTRLQENNENIPSPTGNLAWLDTILHWALIILAILVATVLLQVLYKLLRYLISLLLKKNKGISPDKISFNLLLPWKDLFHFIEALLKQLGLFILPFLPLKTTVHSAYRQLLRWGHWKKCPRQPFETPYGYYLKLSAKYPDLAVELHDITSAYVVYRYSDNQKSDHKVANLKAALRKIYLSDFFRLAELIRKSVLKRKGL